MEKTTALSPFKTMRISTKTSLKSESERGRRQKKHASNSSSNSSYLKTNNNRSSPLENAKDELEVLCVQLNKGIDISEREKEEVDERVKNVEKYYQSSLMSSTMENVANGYWRVIYSTAPPPSNEWGEMDVSEEDVDPFPLLSDGEESASEAPRVTRERHLAVDLHNYDRV